MDLEASYASVCFVPALDLCCGDCSPALALSESSLLTSALTLPHKVQQLNTSGRMVSSGMLCRVALVGTDISEEISASFIRVTRNGELGIAVTSLLRIFLRSGRRLLFTASVVPSSPILVTLMQEAISSS
jgi:hypothetical protein